MEQEYINARLQDLRANIAKCRVRIKEYDDELIDENDPDLQSKYGRRIAKLKKAIESYSQEYKDLQAQAIDASVAPVQTASRELLQIGEELAAVRNSVDVLLVNQKVLLNSFTQHEQALIKTVTEKLNESDRRTVQQTVAAIELNRLTEGEMRLFLEQARSAIATVPQTAPISPQRNQIEEILDDVSLDVKHKLKITVPIIPLLLNYEAEVGLGSADSLGGVWNSLKSKLFGSEIISLNL